VDSYAQSQSIGFAYSNAGAHGIRQCSFEVRDGGMDEVRWFAEVVNVVRTRTLSAMGKSETAATLCYENDAKSDNERDEREYGREDTMPGADVYQLGVSQNPE